MSLGWIDVPAPRSLKSLLPTSDSTLSIGLMTLEAPLHEEAIGTRCDAFLIHSIPHGRQLDPDGAVVNREPPFS